MAKVDFKALMLAKGEKFLLIGALAIGGLLLVWGVASAFGKIDPTAGKKDLDSKSQSLKQRLASDEAQPSGPKKPLPEYTPVQPELFQVKNTTPFDATVWPDRFRELPVVLKPNDSQIDLFLVSVRKHGRDNFVRNDDGEIIDFDAQWITTQADPKVSGREMAQGIREGLNPGKGKKKRGAPQQQPQQPGLGAPGGGGMGPRGGGPGMGGPGMGGFGEGEGFSGQAGPGGFGSGLQAGTKSSETVVEWKKFSAVTEAGKAAVPAYGIFPVRMAVVQLSFPLEDQLKEIQRALRLPNLRQAILETSPEKLFATDPETGKVVPYQTLATGVAPPAGGPAGPSGAGGGLPGQGMAGGGGLPGAGVAGGGGFGQPPRGGGGAAGAGGTGESGTALTADKLTSPVFAGFEVQRRRIFADGAGDWEPFDHADRYFNEFTLYDAPVKPDIGYLPYFLRADQGLAAPMPQVAPGWTTTPQLASGEVEPKEKHYPEYVRMPSIVADFEALRKVLNPVKTKEAIKQYERKNLINPYGVGGGRTGGLGGAGIPGVGGEEDTGYGAGVMSGPGMGGPRGPVGQPNPNAPGGQGVGGAGEQTKSPLAVKHMLIRFLDTDLMPGVSYQYRVAVKLRNPNFNKPKDVADESLAKQEFISSEYFQCRQTLKVPGESHLYAGSIKEYEKKVTDLVDAVKKETPPGVDSGGIAPDRVRKLFEFNEVRDGKRAVVQMQRWVQTVAFGGEEERIGAWVQTEVPVSPGEFIGRRMLVELPLWKAAQGKYQLTPPSKKLERYWPDKVPSPAGRPVDFRTTHVLMDFEGGKASAKVDDRSVSDEAATELLILRADGKLEVRKELTDAANPDRTLRDKNWKDWITEVRKTSPVGAGGTPGTGFEPPRGGGGGAGTGGNPGGGGR